MAEIKPEILKEINTLKERLKEKIDITKIFIYGSYAKGIFQTDSDIDICIIARDIKNNFEATLTASSTSALIDPKLEPIVIAEDEFEYNKSSKVYNVDPLSLSFKCDEQLPASFGCKTTRYCEAGSMEGDCTPTQTASSPLNIQDSKTINYFSEDNGGNIENIKKISIYIGEGSGMELINPRYGVSNVPKFDIIVDVFTNTVECKYGQIDFQYNSRDANLMEKINPNRYIIRNFDIEEQGFGNAYNLNIKCQEVNGFINPKPTIFDIIYNPDLPIIVRTWADPSHVTEGSSTTINLITDTKTICKYDRNVTNYDEMNGVFSGWDEWEDGSPNFNTTHTKIISLTDSENGDHLYYVACQSRSGNISSTSQITFSVNFDERGRIIETSPSGSINTRTINLGLKTTKNAICNNNNHNPEFITTGGVTHTSSSITLLEGIYDYPVTCDFLNARGTGVISFIMDFTKPKVKSIEVGDSCYPGTIMPIFVVEDNLSTTLIYNYSIYESGKVTPILDWTSTTSESPSIDTIGLNVSLGGKYRIKLSVTDEAGNPGDKIITSEDFLLIPNNSTVCLNDKDGPSVIVEGKNTYQGIKVTLKCKDLSGCNELYYGLSDKDEIGRASCRERV